MILSNGMLSRKVMPDHSFRSPWNNGLRGHFFVALAVASGLASAQTQPNSPRFDQIARAVAGACPDVTASIIPLFDAKLITDVRPIDVAALCSCAETGVKTDERLRAFVNDPSAGREQRLKTESAKVYFTTRMVQAMLACMSNEFDASLQAFPLGK